MVEYIKIGMKPQSEASKWVMYIWEKEDWFNSVNSEELLYKAIQECKAIDKEKGIGSIL
jgi:hypothetical protein